MGQRRCVIADCPSQSGQSEHAHVTFHSFPTNVVLRDVWIKNCRIEKTKSLTKSVVVCSRHFVDGVDFQVPRNGKRMLKNGVAPTKFAWGNGVSYQEYLSAENGAKSADTSAADDSIVVAAAAAPTTSTATTATAATTETATAHTDNNDTVITAANANESSSSTSHSHTKIAQSAKKSSSRLRAAAATATQNNTTTNDTSEADTTKPRSASADEPIPVEPSTPNTRSDRSTRKSLDSATEPHEKLSVKVPEIKSPLKRLDTASTLVSGAKVEVQDLNGDWHAARVVEVDQTEQEIFINFDKSSKTKGPTAFRLNDEWIPMDSSRLRVPNTSAKKLDTSVQFTEGDKVLARWTDSRKFPGVVTRVLESNYFEVLFDDGFVKSVKGNHISRQKRPTGGEISGRQTPNISLVETKPMPLPIAPSPLPQRRALKINPIPKFDMTQFNLPEIPADGEWCCPWINDTPIGCESYLVNVDGTRRPTVLVEDARLPANWTKHLYQRSSTSGKWDVVLVGPNNKRFRSKNDCKTYLEELGQPYNPDVYDFSIHKRRAKDLNVYVFTADYVPLALAKPNTSILGSSLDVSVSDIKQEPFPGFAPHEASTSFLSSIGGDSFHDASQSIKLESDDPGFTQIGSLKVQVKDNLFYCPKEGCNKTFRKENIFQIHVKHYHPDLMTQIGECPNMTELAYFRTKGTPSEENLTRALLTPTPIGDKSKSISPPQVKIEPKPEDVSTPLLSTIAEAPLVDASTLKRKQNATLPTSGETKEKRKPTVVDKVASPDTSLLADSSKLVDMTASDVSMDGVTLSSTPITSRKTDGSTVAAVEGDEAKNAAQRPQVPRFKLGRVARGKGETTKRETTRAMKKRLKRSELKRRALEASASSISISDISANNISIDAKIPATKSLRPSKSSRSRLKFVPFRSPENAPTIIQRGNSRYTVDESGELIKIVRMRQEEIINCLCTYPEEDGLMIQCELCLCWQHGGCNGIEKESEVPDKYVCYICRNPERGRASLQYIHDQDWLYDGKLAHASYHQPSKNAPQRTEILGQSHSLTGNLVELKRSMHSLNVKISIARNKDHPKLYLWSKKWESPTKVSPAASFENRVKVEMMREKVNEMKGVQNSQQSMNATVATMDSLDGDLLMSSIDTQTIIPNVQTIIPNGGITEIIGEQTEIKPLTTESPLKTLEVKEPVVAPAPVIFAKPKRPAQVAPTIPEPEAAIDPAECQLRLLEHIQKEQNALISRMQTIDAHIMALEAMDDHPDTNSKADFAHTSHTIRMLMRDLGKMRKLAAINESTIAFNAFDTKFV